jgi:hypothetical protein
LFQQILETEENAEGMGIYSTAVAILSIQETDSESFQSETMFAIYIR